MHAQQRSPCQMLLVTVKIVLIAERLDVFPATALAGLKEQGTHSFGHEDVFPPAGACPPTWLAPSGSRSMC